MKPYSHNKLLYVLLSHCISGLFLCLYCVLARAPRRSSARSTSAANSAVTPTTTPKTTTATAAATPGARRKRALASPIVEEQSEDSDNGNGDSSSAVPSSASAAATPSRPKRSSTTAAAAAAAASKPAASAIKSKTPAPAPADNANAAATASGAVAGGRVLYTAESGFALFASTTIGPCKERWPLLTMAELKSRIKQLWAELPEQEKALYARQAAQEASGGSQQDTTTNNASSSSASVTGGGKATSAAAKGRVSSTAKSLNAVASVSDSLESNDDTNAVDLDATLLAPSIVPSLVSAANTNSRARSDINNNASSSSSSSSASAVGGGIRGAAVEDDDSGLVFNSKRPRPAAAASAAANAATAHNASYTAGNAGSNFASTLSSSNLRAGIPAAAAGTGSGAGAAGMGTVAGVTSPAAYIALQKAYNELTSRYEALQSSVDSAVAAERTRTEALWRARESESERTISELKEHISRINAQHRAALPSPGRQRRDREQAAAKDEELSKLAALLHTQTALTEALQAEAAQAQQQHAKQLDAAAVKLGILEDVVAAYRGLTGFKVKQPTDVGYHKMSYAVSLKDADAARFIKMELIASRRSARMRYVPVEFALAGVQYPEFLKQELSFDRSEAPKLFAHISAAVYGTNVDPSANASGNGNTNNVNNTSGYGAYGQYPYGNAAGVRGVHGQSWAGFPTGPFGQQQHQQYPGQQQPQQQQQSHPMNAGANAVPATGAQQQGPLHTHAPVLLPLSAAAAAAAPLPLASMVLPGGVASATVPLSAPMPNAGITGAGAGTGAGVGASVANTANSGK